MTDIRAPDQAALGCRREIYDDQEQQSGTIPFRGRRLAVLFERRRREYTEMLRVLKFSALFKPEMPMPYYSSPGPLNPSGLPLQNFSLRQRNTPSSETIKSADTLNRSPETTGSDSIVPTKKSQDEVIEVIDFRKLSHERRKKELFEILEPVPDAEGSDNSSIYLCWGKDSGCHIIPVKIPNSADDVTVWKEIRRAWYEYRGGWRKHLPLFGVKEVRIVEISIIGPESNARSESKHKGRLVGTYTTKNLKAERERLEQIIADYHPQESPCEYCPSTGQVECFDNCISTIIDGEDCRERILYQAKRELSRLKTLPPLALAFSDPGLAAANDLLGGTGIINRRLNILSKLRVWHYPTMRELPFRGLMINEGWRLGSQHVVLPLTATLFFLMVIGAKLVYGDWGAAWNVGCFLVSLATLLWMWVNHAVS